VDQKNIKNVSYFSEFLKSLQINHKKRHGTVFEYCLLVFVVFQLRGQKDGICYGITS
jgi:hypothetical protein